MEWGILKISNLMCKPCQITICLRNLACELQKADDKKEIFSRLHARKCLFWLWDRAPRGTPNQKLLGWICSHFVTGNQKKNIEAGPGYLMEGLWRLSLIAIALAQPWHMLISKKIEILIRLPYTVMLPVD